VIPVTDEARGSEAAHLPLRRRVRRWWRSLLGGEAGGAGMKLYGPADLGPGRNATPEEWARYREELRNPPPPQPSKPPPGYKFVWYTDSKGMKHRSAIRADEQDDRNRTDPAG
jgi:hypothetical protein